MKYIQLLLLDSSTYSSVRSTEIPYLKQLFSQNCKNHNCAVNSEYLFWLLLGQMNEDELPDIFKTDTFYTSLSLLDERFSFLLFKTNTDTPLTSSQKIYDGGGIVEFNNTSMRTLNVSRPAENPYTRVKLPKQKRQTFDPYRAVI